MSSSTALNHATRCSQELDNFDHTMGWNFRDLSESDRHKVPSDLDAAEYQELSRTAFGDPIDLPSEFVSPVSIRSKSEQKAAKQKTKKKVTSSVYSKRAIGTTVPSSAKLASGTAPSGTSAQKKRSRVTAPPTRDVAPSSVMIKEVATSARSSGTKSSPSTVDFVYDINVRRKLREDIDNGRLQVLHDAAAKEAQLRAACKWVYDKAEDPSRNNAWTSSKQSPQKQAATGNTDKKTARRIREANRATNCQESTSGVRASLASSYERNSHASAPSKAPAKPAKTVKSSLTPNVSEWRTQAFPVHPSPKAALAKQKREECQRLQKQWCEAKEIQDTIADFETRMKQQWAI